MATVHPVIDKLPTKLNYRWFPSFRMMTATLLCLCFASVHMMNSNMGMAIVCMVNSTEFIDLNFTENRLADDVEEDRAPKLNWSAEEQGYIFSAFNLGLLAMLGTGALCGQSFLFGGWPSIFYLSATTGIVFVIIYIAIGADKPSKQNFISDAELKYILSLNSSEEFGKKRIERKIPWMEILKSSPVWAAVIAVICHEFPLMTMIMFLPSYLHDVHHYTATENGILSALPTASLWISKIFSSYLNTFLQRRTKLRRTNICKLLNTIASCGLAIFLFASTTLDASHASLAVVFLCASMASAGLHTPGCQTALVSLAPAFSGAITGLAFFFVASSEWNTVFFISTLVALVPVVVFNIWGSADVQVNLLKFISLFLKQHLIVSNEHSCTRK
uniref:Sialin n=1 Tax=Parascaris equorum TaxID=6256 RepID=A0A914S034_PAREQ